MWVSQRITGNPPLSNVTRIAMFLLLFIVNCALFTHILSVLYDNNINDSTECRLVDTVAYSHAAMKVPHHTQQAELSM
jgi:hypothetical protein